MKSNLLAEPIDRLTLPQTPSFCAGLVVLVGCVVLFGWFVKSEILVQVYPLFAPMQFNTALCFALVGGGLYGLNEGSLKFGIYASATAALVALLTLYQYAAGYDLGIDELLMKHTITVNTSHPGRMAPNTALCFLLSGIAIATRSALPKRREGILALSTLAAMVTALAGIALVGYFFGLANAEGWGELTRMALHTAVAFLVLSVGILSYARTQVASSGGAGAFAVPLIVFVGSITGTILLWQSLIHEEARSFRVHLTAEAQRLAVAIHSDFDANINALERMRDRWDFGQATPAKAWLEDANNYVQFSRLIHRLYVVDKSYRTLLVSDLKNGGAHSTLSQTPDYLVQNWAAVLEPIALRPTRGVFSSSEKDIFHVVLPLRADSNAMAIIATVDARRWLGEVRETSLASKNRVQIGYRNQAIIGAGIFDNEPNEHHSSIANITLEGEPWWVLVGAKNQTHSGKQLALSSVVLVAGLLVSSLLASMLFFWRKVRSDAVDLAKANDVLAAAYVEKEETEKHFKLLLDSAGEGIFGLDAEGFTTFVNPVACMILGDTAEELIGHRMQDVIVDNQLLADNGKNMQSSLCNAVTDGKVHASNEETLWRKDGSSFAVNYSSTPVYQNKVLVGAVVVFRDITKEVEQTRKLNASNEHLLLANAELEEFAYVASHDLRTPLQGIDHLVEWIAEDVGDDAPDSVSKNLGRIKERIERLQSLIDDLLDYSRASKAEHQLEEIHLEKVIRTLVDDLERGKDFRVTEHGCDIEITVVRMPFETVLRNLIDNAIKHHDKQQGEIEVFVKQAGDGFVSVAVCDDGPGIPPDQHQKVFKLFETLGRSSERTGTGMGLALTKRLVARYGGEIHVAGHDDGRGSCFTFTWPIHAVGA